ncbi:MAG: hypothetical protein M3312_00915 [Actinomycetota bacterium]|nr:hypothetical protein [Actinomycetota bacterium]
MIVRLMGEGQYRVDESVMQALNELDDRAQAAIEAGDEPKLDEALDEMWQAVRTAGERLPDSELSPSHVLIPPSDLTLEETRQLVGSPEGFIPDVPVG